MTSRVEHRLAELGVILPQPPRASGNFAYGIEHGGPLYLSGTYGTGGTPARRSSSTSSPAMPRSPAS